MSDLNSDGGDGAVFFAAAIAFGMGFYYLCRRGDENPAPAHIPSQGSNRQNHHYEDSDDDSNDESFAELRRREEEVQRQREEEHHRQEEELAAEITASVDAEGDTLEKEATRASIAANEKISRAEEEKGRINSEFKDDKRGADQERIGEAIVDTIAGKKNVLDNTSPEVVYEDTKRVGQAYQDLGVQEKIIAEQKAVLKQAASQKVSAKAIKEVVKDLGKKADLETIEEKLEAIKKTTKDVEKNVTQAYKHARATVGSIEAGGLSREAIKNAEENRDHLKAESVRLKEELRTIKRLEKQAAEERERKERVKAQEESSYEAREWDDDDSSSEEDRSPPVQSEDEADSVQEDTTEEEITEEETADTKRDDSEEDAPREDPVGRIIDGGLGDF